MTGAQVEVGKDSRGRWKPGFMTDGEITRELKTAMGDRRFDLLAEKAGRKAQRAGMLKPVTGEPESLRQGQSAREGGAIG